MSEQLVRALASPVMWLAVLAAMLLAFFAREPARRLIDTLFGASGDILERFSASIRSVGYGLFKEARSVLAQMEREEFAHEVAARQKELVSVLDRFGGLEERYANATKALDKAGDVIRRGRAFKALIAISARMAAGQERFNTNVEFVTSNRARLEAVHAGEIYS